MPNAPNNATVVETCTRRIRALGAYVDTRATVGIDGRKHAHAEVVAVYARCVDARAKVANLRAQLAEALDEVGAADAARAQADRALKAWVRGEFGVQSAQASDFGFPPPKKPAMTADQKALAVARGKATRKARRTMGKRQKEEIRGTIAPPVDSPAGRREEEVPP
jgi:hypothetical protein